MASAVAILLMGIGGLILFVGTIMFLIAAYQESFLWALGCFLFSPVQLIFLIMYWKDAKKPFFIQLVGAVLFVAGLMIGAVDLKKVADERMKSAPPAVEAASAPAPAPPVVSAPPADLRTLEERMLAECESELGLLCHGKEGEKAQLNCLRAHIDSLRATCRDALGDQQ